MKPSRAPYVASRIPLSRRAFLRSAGIGLSLPLLQAMSPVLGRTAPTPGPTPGAPRRMLAI